MLKKIKKYWHDPVWSKVIAGAILAGVAAIGAYFLDWWPIIRRMLAATIDFVISNTAIPNLLLGVLAIPWLLIFLLLVLRYKYRNKHRTSQPKPNWYNYMSDTFFGIRWTWQYDDAGNIVKLFSFCSNCDFQIYPKPQHDLWQGFTHLKFHCENCNQIFANQPETIAEFENKIIRHIQLKIRNNSWSTPK